MANRIFRGDAVAVAQIVKITPSHPEVGDTFTILINGKRVDFQATDLLVSTVVDGLVAAWNASTIPETRNITANAVDENGDGESDYLTLTADTPGVPFRVETLTTDAGGFQIQVTTLVQGDPGQNEIQRVSIPSSTSGGTFTLTFEGQTTAGIAYDATPAAVESALEALSNIAPGDVEVTGESPLWYVEFQGNYANVDASNMTGNGASLTGSASITHATLTQGAPAENEIRAFDWRGAAEEPGWAGVAFRFRGAVSPVIVIETTTQIQSALESISTIGAGNVVVRTSGGSGTVSGDGVYHIEFVGELGGQDIGPLELEFTIEGDTTAPNWLTGIWLTTLQNGSPTGTNEVQTVRINGSPTGGNFTLTFQGQTTAAIAHDATAADLKAALELLSNIDLVAVTKSSNTFTVEFQGANAATDVGQMTSDASGLTGGLVTVVTTQIAIPPTNERQRIAFSQSPGGGTFSLSWNPSGGPETTAAIAYDATPAAVRTALESLATPGVGDFQVTGIAGGPWTVEFQGDYAASNVAAITGDASGLTGGGDQDLTAETLVRSRGPNHFDDPDNWTGEAVPNSLDSLFYHGGNVSCLYGLQQRAAFTADAGQDLLAFGQLVDFVEGQAVRLFTTDTLPAGLSTGTTYYILNLDYDAGTCQLALEQEGDAIDITDAGTGAHTIALHLAAIQFHSRWTGNLGLTERNGDYYEYLPRSLSVVVDTITIGEGEGEGQSRLDLDTGEEPATLIVHQSGGSNEAGLPAIRWKGTNSANVVIIHDGEFGAAIYATEQAAIGALVQHAGLVQMGSVTLGGLTKHGGELIAENAALSGALKLHA